MSVSTPAEDFWKESVFAELRPALIELSKQRPDDPVKWLGERCLQISAAAKKACTLRIISVNDVYELDDLPRLATCIKERRRGTTIVTLPGDFLAPSLLSSLDYGKGMIDTLNQCGVEYVCFGNHETDVPHTELIKRIKESKFKWINTNMQEIDLADIGKLPTHEIVTVTGGGQTRNVALLGLLTEDPSLYRPDSFGHGPSKIGSVVDYAKEFSAKLHGTVDLVLPMTHQVMKLDRAFAETFAVGKDGNENLFPLILGAHDHEPYDEIVAGSHIIKVGSDAKNIGISDITWPDAASNKVEVRVSMIPSSQFVKDAAVLETVLSHQKILTELEHAPLFMMDPGIEYTSKSNRLKATSMSVKLVSSIRDAYAADCCILNAGNIRGNKIYARDKKYFTYSDLKTEMPFEVEMNVINIPGKVLSEIVAASREKSFRDPAESSGGFLQIDDHMRFDDSSKTVTLVANDPIVPDREYRVCLLFRLLKGLDNNEPAVAWAKTRPDILNRDLDDCVLAKIMLVDYFAKAIFYQMGTFDEIDADKDGFISKEEVHAATSKHFGDDVAMLCVDNIMRASDLNHDGRISKAELLRVNFVNAWARHDMASSGQNGLLTVAEIEAFARKVVGDEAVDCGLVDEMMNELVPGASSHSGGASLKDIEGWINANFKRTIVLPGVKNKDAE